MYKTVLNSFFFFSSSSLRNRTDDIHSVKIPMGMPRVKRNSQLAHCNSIIFYPTHSRKYIQAGIRIILLQTI